MLIPLFSSDRATGERYDIKAIGSFFEKMADKGLGRVVRQSSHVFFCIDTKYLMANHSKLGLTYENVAKAMAKESKLPPNFIHLLG